MIASSPRCRALAAAALAVLLVAVARAQVTVSDTGSFVIDKAGVLDAATKEKLQLYLAELERKTGAQVKVLTVETVGEEGIFPFAQRHYELWKLGQQDKDNGALIVLAVKDRRARIHSGYGLEGALPDGWDGTLLRRVRDAYFRQGNYSAGVLELALSVAQKVADEQHVKLTGVPAPALARQETDATGLICFLIVLLLLLGLMVWMFRRRRGRGVWTSGWTDSIAWGSVLDSMLRDASRSSWSSGGGFGGGFGGGLGGGSFGGGGHSGGGGADTSW